MQISFELASAEAANDLKLYLNRLLRIDEGAVKLQISGDVLAVWGAAIWPKSITDPSPTALGLRTFRITPQESATYEVGASLLSNSIADDGKVSLEVADTRLQAAWLGQTPPRADWELLGEITAAALENEAIDAANEVTDSTPLNSGALVVDKIRAVVWGRKSKTWDGPLPKAASFAMLALGFLSPLEKVTLFRSGSWLRLTSSRGHVLVKALVESVD